MQEVYCMTEEIKRIIVNGNEVGIIGLSEAFQKIKASGLTEESIIKTRLLELLRENNYIPNQLEESYKQSLYREYRIFLGEKVEPVASGLLEIRILGPGCINCQRLEQETQNALAELNISADLQHIYDIKEFAQYGVAGSPALIINHNPKAVGRVPHKDQIKKWIEEEVGNL
jgi:small redox-active disulfide protein 2